MTHPIEGGLSELISRLEAASEGSRELDALVGLAIRDDYPHTSAEILGDGMIRDGAGPYYAKHHTTSLDAIVALIERKLPVLADFYIAQHRGSAQATIWLNNKPYDGVKPGRQKPLAACIALLKALQDQQVTS
jgi:hypothetical protein